MTAGHRIEPRRSRHCNKAWGKTVELFPPAAPYIPFIQPMLDFIPVAMDFFDPDDNLISGRVIVTKTKIQVNGKDQIQWKLENPVVHNDNGKIILTISPRPNRTAMWGENVLDRSQ